MSKKSYEAKEKKNDWKLLLWKKMQIDDE